MAEFSLNSKFLSRSGGRSSVQFSAYISGENLKDERLNKTFSRSADKDPVTFSEIILPENAPKEFSDRETLWNSVEEMEKQSNSQVGQSLIIALPIEWQNDVELQKSMIHQFVLDEFTKKGFVCDCAIHNKAGNPHAHVLVSPRTITKDGEWQKCKAKRVYKKDEQGHKIPLLDENGNQKKRVRSGKGVELLWEREWVEDNPWAHRKTDLESMRTRWETYCNFKLDIEHWVSAKSYAERGIDKLPTYHVGAFKNPEIIALNESIKAYNELTQTINNFQRDIARGLYENEKRSNLDFLADEWRKSHPENQEMENEPISEPKSKTEKMLRDLYAQQKEELKPFQKFPSPDDDRKPPRKPPHRDRGMSR